MFASQDVTLRQWSLATIKNDMLQGQGEGQKGHG